MEFVSTDRLLQHPYGDEPAGAAGLVGRGELLGELEEALATSRLVTLVGPGGIGKTALATAASASASASGAVCIVELAPVAPDGDLTAVVINALGLRNESLVQGLAGRELLLVLDHCEHVFAAAARLAGELLDGCPGLRILATSREALGIQGETRFAVPALALDDAVRLFTERAQAVDQAFQLDPALERTCAHGLPLAIELAAARVDSVPLDELICALADHKTLGEVIAWSWELLPPVERVIAARLAVFPGGATPDSVAAVLDLPRPIAARLLTALTERALLTTTDGRYRMPETIRAYAGERLTPDEIDDLHARHAAYLLELVRRADQHLRGPEQLHWATLLRRESGSLREAINWAVGHDPRLALRLVAGLSTYWWMHGLRGEAGRAAHDLLAVLGPVVPDGLAEEYLLAVLHAAGSDLPDGLEQARIIVEELDEPFRHPVTVLLWSVVLGPFVPPDLVTEVLARNELSIDPWTLAALQLCAAYPGLTGLGTVEPGAILQSALERFQLTGDRWGVSLALNALAELAAGSKRFDLAIELIGQALSIAEELDSGEEAMLLLCRRGDLRLRLGELRTAGEDYARALVLAERAGLPDHSTAAQIGLARSARYGGDLAKAQELALLALARCPEGWDEADLAMTEALGELAAIAAAAGRPDEAPPRAPSPCGSGHSG